ncbi:hypothetical protein MZD09_05615, partial [Escherichia coli]|nr:hypothetical protein [Escherichia coli]
GLTLLLQSSKCLNDGIDLLTTVGSIYATAQQRDACRRGRRQDISKAERVFIQLAIKEHYHELIDSPGTLANIFTALSKKHESPFDFDKSTIGRWIKTAR